MNKASDRLEEIQKTIKEYVEGNTAQHVGVVTGVISPDAPNGQLLFAGERNFWNSQNQHMSLTGDTLFEIASITKVFTSLLVYIGNSTIDFYGGTLGQFFTALSPTAPVAKIPILDLANYSPGLPQDNHGGFWPARTMDNLSNLLTWLDNYQPPASPGQYYSYSNLGWSLIGMAACSISSEQDDYTTLYGSMVSELGRDFQMTNTQLISQSLVPNLPLGHDKSGNPIQPNQYASLAPMLLGAGAIVSTGNDMMKWLSGNMGYGPVAENILKTQQSPRYTLPKLSDPKVSGPTVSIGWFVHAVNVDGQTVYYLAKDGGLAGFTSWMGFQTWDFVTPSPIGTFVLTNSHGAAELGQKIMNILFGIAPPEKFEAPEGMLPLD